MKTIINCIIFVACAMGIIKCCFHPDSSVEPDVSRLAKDLAEENFGDDYIIGDCVNYTVNEKFFCGKRGSIDVEMTGKKSSKKIVITYDFESSFNKTEVTLRTSAWLLIAANMIEENLNQTIESDWRISSFKNGNIVPGGDTKYGSIDVVLTNKSSSEQIVLSYDIKLINNGIFSSIELEPRDPMALCRVRDTNKVLIQARDLLNKYKRELE